MPIAASLAASPVLPAMKVVICQTKSARTREQNDGMTSAVISLRSPIVSIYSSYVCFERALLEVDLRTDCLESNLRFSEIGF